jgi:galactokinase
MPRVTNDVDEVRVWAPGRVNLIGDHTDYTGGLAFPIAIQLGIELVGIRGGDRLQMTSAGFEGELDVVLPLRPEGASATSPTWAAAPVAVAALAASRVGLRAALTSTLPPGSGLSSSAALEVATALALGADDGRTVVELAELCVEAERVATGVPCGILDQLSSLSGVAGHGLLMDCRATTVEAVPLPERARWFVVDSGSRVLADGEYAARREQCERAEAALGGPLRDTTLADLDGIDDDLLRRRARHVVGENQRVLDFADALRADDLATAGRLMVGSHRSLADDYEVSTADLDRLVDDLLATPGVLGARLTGGGFGGCAVALCDREVDVPGAIAVVPSSGATRR